MRRMLGGGGWKDVRQVKLEAFRCIYSYNAHAIRGVERGENSSHAKIYMGEVGIKR